MANTLKTTSNGDIVRRALAIFHNKLKFIKTINRQYDARFQVEGAKNGGTLLIRDPNQFTVTTGATLDIQDVTETTQSLTVSTQKHVGLPEFSSLEMSMSIDDFEERYLEPAMARLAAEVESDVLTNVYKDIFNLSTNTGTATNPNTLLAIRNASVKLSQGLAPASNRSLLLDSVAMAGTLNSMNAYFHKASELNRSFEEGFIGHAVGFDWYESEMVPRHTNGSRTDSTPLTNAATAQTGASLICDGFGSTVTIKKGDVFTIADVYAVNPETKQRYDHLQQFVATADKTASGGAVTLAISPSITTTGAKQNVSTGAANDKALVFVAAGGSGTGSAVYTQNLAYHRDAFTFVSADLHMEPTQNMARANMEGISMRFWRGADITNDKFPARLDVLYGFKTIRPEWACRVRG